MAVAPDRTQRRRAAARGHIVATAARLFAERGLDGVRLDEIADAADVARGTLYSHFPSKDDLLAAIMVPVLEHAAERAVALAGKPRRAAVEGLVELYVELWRGHAHALRVAHQLRGPAASAGIAAAHRRYMDAVLVVLRRAAAGRLLRFPTAEAAAHALWRVSVPLLEVLGGAPEGERAFVEGVASLLLRPQEAAG